MSDQFPVDPELESLAARLSSLAPRLGAEEQRALLYQSAFGAGEKSARRRATYWRNACAGVSVALCGAIAFAISPFAHEGVRSEPGPDPSIPVASSLLTQDGDDTSAARPVEESPELVTQRTSVPLDAWAVPRADLADFDEAFDRVQKLDSAGRAHTVAALRYEL